MAAQGVCSIQNCGKVIVNLRGWCPGHYQRWRKHGSPHVGGPTRTANGEPLRYLQIVLDYEGNDCLPWPYTNNGKGAGTVWIDGRHKLVSRIVCAHTHGSAPTPEHEAAHSCGKGHLSCVTKHHLSWKTPTENQADKIAHGTTNRGERQGRSKLTEKDVQEIRRWRGAYTQQTLAKRYGVSAAHISGIQTGRFWGWLP